MKNNNEYFEIGKIVNTVGLKGEIKIYPYTDDIYKFEDFDEILIEENNNKVPYEIESCRIQKNMVIMKLKDIKNINDAESLRDRSIYIKRSDEDLPEGTYYIADLIGLNVYTDEGILLGVVNDIYNRGAQDIYEVKDESGKLILLPAIDEVLKDIDLENEKITVHIIKGLLD